MHVFVVVRSWVRYGYVDGIVGRSSAVSSR